MLTCKISAKVQVLEGISVRPVICFLLDSLETTVTVKEARRTRPGSGNFVPFSTSSVDTVKSTCPLRTDCNAD